MERERERERTRERKEREKKKSISQEMRLYGRENIGAWIDQADTAFFYAEEDFFPPISWDPLLLRLIPTNPLAQAATLLRILFSWGLWA